MVINGQFYSPAKGPTAPSGHESGSAWLLWRAEKYFVAAGIETPIPDEHPAYTLLVKL
jgi:hypothetical protein